MTQEARIDTDAPGPGQAPTLPAPDASPTPVAEDALRGIDTSVPNVARMYDLLLGGKENFASDRQAAEELIRLVPDAVKAANNNRIFLRRAVSFLAKEASVRQFIDIGTGLPTQGNVHEVAQRAHADARVLYVDNDPVVIAHAQALLADNATVVAINRDLRDPQEILSHPALQALINLEEPFAVLLVAVLHFIRDADNPRAIVKTLVDAMPSGSYLVISHTTAENVSASVMNQIWQLYDRATAPAAPRSHSEIESFFDGLDILPPGLVDVSSWRTNASAKPARTIFYAAVGSKR